MIKDKISLSEENKALLFMSNHPNNKDNKNLWSKYFYGHYDIKNIQMITKIRLSHLMNVIPKKTIKYKPRIEIILRIAA